jgi:hypothetical protein
MTLLFPVIFLASVVFAQNFPTTYIIQPGKSLTLFETLVEGQGQFGAKFQAKESPVAVKVSLRFSHT